MLTVKAGWYVMKRDGDELDDRKKLILRAVVDAHIKGGAPVGSKFLTQNKQITLSSATIRNEMAELEEMGYLEQPHTSAGRIPSELGYRFYVNSLMQSYRLSANELRQLNTLMRAKIAELDKLLEGASKLISMLTNYTSLTVKPKRSATVITHFRIMYLEPCVFLLVMITSADIVKTRYIRTQSELSEETLRSLESALNAVLTGIQMEAVTLPLIMELNAGLPECEQLISPIIKCIYDAMSEIDSGDLHYEGINLLLQYPEYADIDKFKELLGVLERKEDILNLVSESDYGDTHVIIGAESPVTVTPNSTLIFRKIRAGDHVVGAIGVLGPCRMDYSRVITTVEHLANSISELAAGETRAGDGDVDKPPDT